VGQPELVELHHYTYEIDTAAMLDAKKVATDDLAMVARVRAVNKALGEQFLSSTNRSSDYDKLLSHAQFVKSRHYETYLSKFMSPEYFTEFAGLGFSQINLKEKDVNALTRTAFYDAELMSRAAWRQEHEFEKECLNQIARSNLREHLTAFCGGDVDLRQGYTVSARIGQGFTYSKYNTLMHFLNVTECYWHNPDLNSIGVFGKDVRAVRRRPLWTESGSASLGAYSAWGGCVRCWPSRARRSSSRRATTSTTTAPSRAQALATAPRSSTCRSPARAAARPPRSPARSAATSTPSS
jgi:hypothetical protein